MKVGATPDDRAWSAWYFARLRQVEQLPAPELDSHLRARADRWDSAIALARGTRWATAVVAEDFLWRANLGWSRDAAPGQLADIPALLAEAGRLRAALESSPEKKATGPLIQQLQQLESKLGAPRLEVRMAAQFSPGEAVKFAYGTTGFGGLTLTLHRLDPADWARQNARRSEELVAGEQLRRWSIPLPGAAQRVWHSESIDLGAALKPGFYSLIVRAEQPVTDRPVVQRRDFIVSAIRGLGVVSNADTSELFVYAAADGQPVAGAQARGVVADTGTSIRLASWQGVTDTRGRVVVVVTAKWRWQVLAGVVGEQPFWFGNPQYGRDDAPLLVDAFVERPLYRPGETARWKLVVRERQPGRYALPEASAKFRMKVELGEDTLVPETDLVLNSFGTAQGEIAIPAAARPGSVRLTLNDGEGSGLAARELFQVDNFVPPAVTAKLELVSGADSLRPGQEMVVRLTANYFSGGPIAGAPVECRIGQGRGRAGEEVYRARTDDKGTAEFRRLLAAEAVSPGTISCHASVLPEGAPAAEATAEYRVSAAGFSVDAPDWARARLFRAGEDVTFTATVHDGPKAPAAFRGTMELVEKKWSEAWLGPQGQVLDGEEYRKVFREWVAKQQGQGFVVTPEVHALVDWKQLHNDFSEILVEEKQVVAGPDGQIAASIRLPHDGLFELRVLRAGLVLPVDGTEDYRYHQNYGLTFNLGHSQRPSGFTLVAAGEGTDTLAARPDGAGLAWSGLGNPQKGFTLLAILPEGTTQAWLTVIGEQEAVTKPVTLRGRLGYLAIDQPPEFFGEGLVHLSYRLPAGGNVESMMSGFKVTPESSGLTVSIVPDAATRRPGETAKLMLAVTDQQGRPKRSELAVSVADEAVVNLVEPDADKEQPAFLEARYHRNVGVMGFGWAAPYAVNPIPDPRSGVRLNGHTGDVENDEIVILSPFTVDAAPSGGYAASASLAGARSRAQLSDLGSAVTVITSQFLHDAGAANKEKVMAYITGTEAEGAPGTAPRTIEIRTHFSSTAHWAPAVVTDKNGRTEIPFKYPDNLTQWRISAYAVGEGANTFGRGSTRTQTSLPLQARLNLPRFLVAGDTAEASAALVNRTDQEFSAAVELKMTGGVAPVEPAGLRRPGLSVPRQAEARAAWMVSARKAGAAEFSLAAVAGAEADAMRLPLPVLEDGLQQETAATGRLAPEAGKMTLTLPMPPQLDRERTNVTLQLSPSHAATMLDALPYLIDYPYGCVEQTMSRFLPAVVVRKTLVDLGLDADEVEARIVAKESAADAKRRKKTAGISQLDEVIALGLARLKQAPAQDGLGFGWWPGAPTADLWMTAYVAWGLKLANNAGVTLPEDAAADTFAALIKAVLANHERDDREAFALAILSEEESVSHAAERPKLREVFAAAYGSREKLAASGRACLVLASRMFGEADQRDVLLRNLENGAVRVKSGDFGDTVHWGASADYWRAMDGAGETTALTLLALLKVAPGHPLIEPAVNWLVLNRRSAHWSSTRDTTFAILALNEYIQQTKELATDREMEVLVNGTTLRKFKVTRASLLEGSMNLTVPLTALRPGDNRFELRRVGGAGPVYVVALGSAWALSEGVRPAASLIGVARGFEQNQTQPTLFGTLHVAPRPLPSGGRVIVGEQVSARVTLTAPNELEYLMIEVPKPAGCEPLNALSGWDAELVRVDETAGAPAARPHGRAIYREERDDKSVFFLDRLESGTWEIRFSLRATTVGDFRALPVEASAMYVPEVRANSDARRLRIARGD